MAEDKVSLPFKFEYAVSGRSSCKSSGEPIPVGTARVGMYSIRCSDQCYCSTYALKLIVSAKVFT